jgi:type IV pilus assembly protein PilC
VQWDRFKFKIPMKIGGIIQKVALARFSRTYAALIGAGVPMLEAIEITGRTSGNKVVELAMQAVHDSVRRGGTIAEPMRLAAQAFPPMVAVGEETGGLDHMLSKVADFYEDEVAAAVKALTSIIEPVMIVLVGVIVGFIVISMYMPMFKVYDQIKVGAAWTACGKTAQQRNALGEQDATDLAVHAVHDSRRAAG